MKNVSKMGQTVLGIAALVGASLFTAPNSFAVDGVSTQYLSEFCVDRDFKINTGSNGKKLCRKVGSMSACPSGSSEDSLGSGADVCVGSAISAKQCSAPSDAAVTVTSKVVAGANNDQCIYERATDVPTCAAGSVLTKSSDAGTADLSSKTVGAGDVSFRPKYTCVAVSKPSLRSSIVINFSPIAPKLLQGVTIQNFKASSLIPSAGSALNPAKVEGIGK